MSFQPLTPHVRTQIIALHAPRAVDKTRAFL